jgi:hypothetical protein
VSEDKLRNATIRASRAKALLDDDMLQEAFDSLDAAYVKAWRDSDPRDDDGRQRLWQAIQVLGKVRGHLVSVVNNGKLAQAEIDQLVADETRKKRFGII